MQLWHGIPLKHIQLDSPVTFPGRFGRVLRWAYKRSSANIDLVPAASSLSAARLVTAFGLPATKVVATGDPRDDVLHVYYDTPRSLRPKLALANERGLTGAGFWALGYERGLPEYTDLIAAFRDGQEMTVAAGGG